MSHYKRPLSLLGNLRSAVRDLVIACDSGASADVAAPHVLEVIAAAEALGGPSELLGQSQTDRRNAVLEARKRIAIDVLRGDYDGKGLAQLHEARREAEAQTLRANAAERRLGERD